MMIHIAAQDTQSNLTGVEVSDIQPNAVDLRVEKIFQMNEGAFVIGEENGKEVKIHRGSSEIPVDSNGYWNLPAGTYEIIMENIIHVGDDEAGWVITRSTLNRNGLFITSGLYDSGYNGVMAGALHVKAFARIKKGTRVGQFLLFKSQSLKQYDGDYGLGKEHDQKYA
jgi:deoxycytidine triphosphate deaminase